MISLVYRDLKGSFGWMVLPILTLSFAMASRFIVLRYNEQVKSHITQESQKILGGDLEISGSTSLSPTHKKTIQTLLPSHSLSESLEFLSMVDFSKNIPPQLVDVKVIDDHFPLKGTIEGQLLSHSESLGLQSLLLTANRTRGKDLPRIWIQSDLLTRFKQLGGTYTPPEIPLLRLGFQNFELQAIVTRDPTSDLNFISLGPKVWIHRDDLSATGLAVTGSRIRYRYLFSFESTSISDEALKKQKIALEDYLKSNSLFHTVKTFNDNNSRLANFSDRLNQFLTLLSLLGILISGLGIFSALKTTILRSTQKIAILKALGTTSTQMIVFFSIELMFLFFIAYGLGIIIGISLFKFLPSVIPIPIPVLTSINLKAELPLFIKVFLEALAYTITFSLPAFAFLASISPQELWSQTIKKIKPSLLILCSLIIIFSFSLLVILELKKLTFSFYFLSAILFLLLLNFLLITLGIKLITPLTTYFSSSWRYGFRLIERNPLRSLLNICILSLSLTLLLTLFKIEHSIINEFKMDTQSSLPQLFLLDVREDQKSTFLETLSNHSIQPQSIWAKWIKARWTKHNSKPLSSEQIKENRGSEVNLSTRENLYESESLVKGRFWNTTATEDSAVLEASIEEGYSKRMNLKLGDLLEFQIQGVPVHAQITSLRRVRWSTFEPNFFILLQPGSIDNAPYQWIATLSGMQNHDKIMAQTLLTKNFPTTTSVDLAQMSERALELSKKIALMIKFLSIFCFLSGLTVLIFTLLESIYASVKEIILLRTLGASKIHTLMTQLSELLWVALFSIFISTLSAILLSKIILHQFFVISTPFFNFNIKAELIVLALFLAVLITLGMIISQRITRRASFQLLLKD